MKDYKKLEQIEKDKLVKPILDHIYKVFDKKEWADFIIMNHAYTVQFPMNKKENGVSIIIQGDQGAGKSFIVEDIFMAVIGKQYYFYTANPQDVFGTHGEAIPNKLVMKWKENQHLTCQNY